MKKKKITKRWPKMLGFFVLFAFLVVLPLASKAMVKDKQTENIYVGPDEVINYNLTEAGNLVDINGVINGDVWVAGSEVRINATVKGDIFAVGNNVTISGPVEGSVFAAASNVVVEGEVQGSVRVAGSNVEIKSKVGKNVLAFGSNVRINKEAEVGLHVRAGGAFVNISGKVNGNIDVDGASVALDSEVGGYVNANLGSDGTLSLEPNALIKGDLNYTAEKDAEIRKGAVVEGNMDKKVPEVKVRKKEFWSAAYFFKKLISLFSLLVLGLIIISLMKKKVLEVTKQMLEKPAASLGWGVVFFIVTPIVCLLLLFTIIGIPLAFILGGLYIIALYLAKVFAGVTIGYWLLNYFGNRKKLEPAEGGVSLMWAMVLGVVVLVILISIPFVGWLIKFLAIWWALGALLEVKKKMVEEWK